MKWYLMRMSAPFKVNQNTKYIEKNCPYKAFELKKQKE